MRRGQRYKQENHGKGGGADTEEKNRAAGRERSAAGWGRNLLCGALIGVGAILPGLSGGVLAVAFGVYRPFLELLSHPKSALRRNWELFLTLGIGWCAGFLLFARGLAAAMRSSDTVMLWLFIGLIAGTIPSLFQEAGKEGRPPAAWASLFLCAPVFFAGMFYVCHILRFTASPGPFWDFFCGCLWGAGIVIPGFTASPLMMALGLYQPMLERMSRLDLAAFAACVPGMLFSVALLARGMNWLFRKYYAVVCHGVTGIVAASTAAILPKPASGQEALWSALCGAGGFLLAFALTSFPSPSQARGQG